MTGNWMKETARAVYHCLVDFCAENRRLCWVFEGHFREVFGNLTFWGCVFGEEAQCDVKVACVSVFGL
jgi:hypothetical protein